MWSRAGKLRGCLPARPWRLGLWRGGGSRWIPLPFLVYESHLRRPKKAGFPVRRAEHPYAALHRMRGTVSPRRMGKRGGGGHMHGGVLTAAEVSTSKRAAGRGEAKCGRKKSGELALRQIHCTAWKAKINCRGRFLNPRATSSGKCFPEASERRRTLCGPMLKPSFASAGSTPRDF